MNPLIFNYPENSTQIRILQDQNGNPLFVAKDVCSILGLTNSNKAISALDEDEKGVTTSDTLGGKQKLSFVTESGLYQLIFISRKPEAKKFRKWVTAEVLPQIRKTGSYTSPVQIREALVAKPTQCLQALKAVTNFGYKCLKELEQPLNVNEQMHVFTRFINVCGLDFAQIQTQLQEHYKNQEAQNYYANNSYNPFAPQDKPKWIEQNSKEDLF